MLKSYKLLVTMSLLLAICITYVHSHSFPMSEKTRRQADLVNKDKDLPMVWSYHIHCNFVNGDNDDVQAAMDLRQAFIKYFNLSQVKACQSLFDDIRLCMFDVELIPDLESPFVSGHFRIVPREPNSAHSTPPLQFPIRRLG